MDKTDEHRELINTLENVLLAVQDRVGSREFYDLKVEIENTGLVVQDINREIQKIYSYVGGQQRVTTISYAFLNLMVLLLILWRVW